MPFSLDGLKRSAGNLLSIVLPQHLLLPFGEHPYRPRILELTFDFERFCISSPCACALFMAAIVEAMLVRVTRKSC